ncbi:MAG: exodeoxyribonuclease VII large subunit [Erysipelotrichaceae bacterium]|nr:exodeoxyribonuclease VII large subunit [Erysipelotrichaceae bacterium]
MSKPVWSVSALNAYMKQKIDADAFLQGIIIQGEISNFNRHSSGHWYFTLKDERSRISCVMFASYARNNLLIPTNGMKVLIKGSLSVFETSGQYQIYVNKITEDGIGDLYYQFEQLKKKLANEGLFLEEHKKPLPTYPMKIGVITGANTAALQDIKTTLARRWPIAEVLVFPCLVQGEQAKYEIVKAIEEADSSLCDVLLLARGGGSIEDLWAFNEEMVARSVYDCKTPIVTGVGHEIDTTIVDFVADRRAPTPTGAAEMVSPDYQKVIVEIDNYKKRLLRLQLLQVPTLQLDFYSQKLQQYASDMQQYNQVIQKYKQQLIQQMQVVTLQHKHMLDIQNDKLVSNINKCKENYSKEIQNYIHLLDAYSPLQVLKRGYAIVSKESEITSIHEVNIDDCITTRLQDGYIQSVVTRKESL